MSQNKDVDDNASNAIDKEKDCENVPPQSTTRRSNRNTGKLKKQDSIPSHNKKGGGKNANLLTTNKSQMRLEKGKKVLGLIQEPIAGTSSAQEPNEDVKIDDESQIKSRRKAAPVWLGISDEDEDECKSEHSDKRNVESDVVEDENIPNEKSPINSKSKLKHKTKTNRIFITEKFLGIVGESMTPELRSEAVDKINLELAKLDPNIVGNKKIKKRKIAIKDKVVNEMINTKFECMYDTLLDLANTNRDLMKQYQHALKTLPEDDPRVERLAKYLSTHVGL